VHIIYQQKLERGTSVGLEKWNASISCSLDRCHWL